MPPFRQRGQASAEYVAVIAVIAIVLAGAATVVAAPEVPRLVTAKLRLALCIVGADVCSANDARARGLGPCVLASKERVRGLSTLITVIKSGDGDSVRVERRSDGSYLLSAGNAPMLGGSVGIGFRVSRSRKASADATADVRFASGVSWVARDRAELMRGFGDVLEDPHDVQLRLRMLKDALPGGATTYHALDGSARAEGQLEVEHGAGADLALGSVGGRGAIGRSHGRDGTTWYYDVAGAKDGPLGDLLPDADGHRLAVAWRQSDPPVLTVTARAPLGGDRSSETVARFVLADPADRALARRWVLSPQALGDTAGRGLAARLREHGTLQRSVYAEAEHDEGSFDVSGKLGIGLGVERDAKLTRRTLLDAELLGADGMPARRADCLDDFDA